MKNTDIFSNVQHAKFISPRTSTEVKIEIENTELQNVSFKIIAKPLSHLKPVIKPKLKSSNLREVDHLVGSCHEHETYYYNLDPSPKLLSHEETIG